MTTAHGTRFQLMVLYDWKAGIDAQRIAVHAQRIRALPSLVPGLIEVRFGPRLCGHPQGESEGWDHAAVMVFARHADFVAFGATRAHDDVAIELVADLERISSVGFAG
ncbi:MAG TPA: Dabb family protein [Planctomycetota bacterium]|nr:Dabb family protein [Planctomycetota bacterium]